MRQPHPGEKVRNFKVLQPSSEEGGQAIMNDVTAYMGSESTATGWCVYIISCSDNTLYTGITTDIDRRFRQHRDGVGAKYFRGRQPVQVVFLEGGHSRSSASRREAQIKLFSKADKTLLLSRQSGAEE
jgi:putative endonuclease